MTYDPTWIRKSPILIPQAVQNESLTAQKGSVRLDALDWGQKIGNTVIDSNQIGGLSISMAPLNNNKMFVAWVAGTEGRYAIIDSNGTMDSTAYQVFEATNLLDTTANFGVATVLLADGNVALSYAKSGSPNELVFKIYDENGDLVKDAVTVKTQASEEDWGIGLAALPDGNFVVTWQEGSVGNMSYFAIYDSDGDIVKGYTSLGGAWGMPQAAPLSDGNFIVTYEKSGGVWFRTYTRQGIGVLGETLLKAGVSQAPGIRTLGNGQIVVPFIRGFGILDRQGNVVKTPEIKEVAGSYSLTVLPHDNIVAQNNNGVSGYYRIFNSAGVQEKGQTTYTTAGSTIISGDVATFKNGNFMFAYLNGSYVSVVIHQGTKAGFAGDLAVDGELTLASGVAVNNISNDGTLAADSSSALSTQQAVKTYVDNAIAGGDHTKIYDDDSYVQVVDDGTASGVVNVVIDNTQVATFSENGFNIAGSPTYADKISNDYQMGGYDGATGSQTAIPTEYAARKYVDDINLAVSEPTGFAAGNDDNVSTIGIDGSATFFIEPYSGGLGSYDIFFSGERYRKTTKETVEISDVEGLHYVYFDRADGVLKESTTWTVLYLYRHVYVAIVYWDATNKEIIYLGDERHGATMDGKTHLNIHTYRGTLYYSGLALGDITADSTGASNVDAQFSMSNGLIIDEDISHTIPAEAFPMTVPKFYLDGSANWRKSAATAFPVLTTGTGRAAWNKDTAGTWSLEEVTDGNFVLAHVFCTNDETDPTICIVGQAEYATIELARAGASEEINSLVHGDMPFAEFKPVATVILETSDSFTNDVKSVIRTNDEGATWTDWRTSGITSGQGSVTDHGSLSGLANDDHLQYYRVDGFRPITGNLVVNGTSTLQSAVEAQAGLDVSGGVFSLATGTTVNDLSTDGTLSGDSDDSLVTEKAIKTYVDTEIAAIPLDQIFADDSYVKVVDDGTATGYVEIVTDGVQVAYFDAAASSIRIGKPSSAGRITMNDTSLTAYLGINQIINANASGFTLGDSANHFATTAWGSGGVAVVFGGGVQWISAATSYMNLGISGSVAFNIQASAKTITASIDGSQVSKHSSTGVQLATGATVNEFSTDVTMAGASNTAVPTELAVKTYVDSQIGGQSNIIFQDDSHVQVVDDGTATGYVEIVTDGVQVAYFDALSSTQRIGKSLGAGRLEVADASITAHIATTTVLSATATSQTLGVSTDSRITVDQSADQVLGYAGTALMLTLGLTSAQLGLSGDSYIVVDSGGNTASIYAGGTNVLNSSPTTQTLGVSGDSRIVLNQTTDTAQLYAGAVEVLNATPTTQRLGASGDTALTLNTSADTFTLSAGATTMVSGSTTSISLGVAGDTTITLDSSIDQVAITAGGQSQILVETSGTTVYDDLTVTGDLFVDGTTFVVHNQEVTTSDNIIVVNYGEPGAGVTAGTAGMQVDRGTLPDYFFVFAENTDTFRVGEEGDTQAVATREDNPVSNNVPYWNDTDKRFDTAGDTYINIDQTSGAIVVGDNSVEAMTVDETGLKLELGATVNEFSTDGTLAGNSDQAVPTEKAVKTYVDTQVLAGSYIISADDSYVQVVDDGTATGYVEIVTDNTQVAYFDNLAATQRIGKASGAGRLEVSDTYLWGYVGTALALNIQADSQSIGISTDTNMTITQSTDTIAFEAANTTEATINTSGLTLKTGASVNEFSTDGTLADDSNTAVPTEAAVKTYVDTEIAAIDRTIIFADDSFVKVVDDGTATGYVEIQTDGVQVAYFDAAAASIRIGKASGAGRLVINDTTFDAFIGINQLIDASSTQWQFGDAYTHFSGTQWGSGSSAIIFGGGTQHFSGNATSANWGSGTTIGVNFDISSKALAINADSVQVLSATSSGVRLTTGAYVTEFSTDVTLSGDSDTVVPTEHAIKTYVDSQIGGQSNIIWQDDSKVEVVDDGTATGYVQIVADGVQVAYFDALSSTQRIGKAAESRMLVADDTVTFYAGASAAVQATLGANGLSLASGVTVNNISSSTSLGTSNTTLITQGAAMSYIDTGDDNTYNSAVAAATAYADGTTLVDANLYTDAQIAALRNEVDLINLRTVTADSTATTGDVILVDTTAGDVNIEMIVAEDSRIIVKKKTTDGNKVNISTSSGTVDGQNLIIIDTPYQSFTFVSDGSNFYII